MNVNIHEDLDILNSRQLPKKKEHSLQVEPAFHTAFVIKETVIQELLLANMPMM